MPSWTAEADRRLLLSIITAQSPSPPKWDEVLKLMGGEYTAEAIRQRYQKIRKLAATELNDPDEAGSAKKVTPRKRTVKKNEDKNGDAGGQSDDDDEESPSKKIKDEFA